MENVSAAIVIDRGRSVGPCRELLNYYAVSDLTEPTAVRDDDALVSAKS